MSINAAEFAEFAGIARDAVRLIDATTIAITDLQTKRTRDQLAVLVNRFYNETPNVGTPTALAES